MISSLAFLCTCSAPFPMSSDVQAGPRDSSPRSSLRLTLPVPLMYCMQSRQQAAVGARSGTGDVPGPGAYSPVTAAIKQAPPSASFGTSSRDNEAARYISSLHNAAMPVTNTPGPGTYR